METQIIEQMQTKVQTLWEAIQTAATDHEQARLRQEYRRALEIYRLQRLIAQGKH